jgi:hypothetical protein
LTIVPQLQHSWLLPFGVMAIVFLSNTLPKYSNHTRNWYQEASLIDLARQGFFTIFLLFKSTRAIESLDLATHPASLVAWCNTIAYLFWERNLHRYQQKIAALILAHIKVSVPQNQAFVVGCKNEGFPNQLCQWEGNNLIFRVPTYLESKFGNYVESKIGGLPRKINRTPVLATTY